jgi:glycerol-1-phosphate dehydrogenase [NAD(P)+]
MPDPWALVDAHTRDRAAAVVLVESTNRDVLDLTEVALPPVDAVVGIGGGAAIDAAKYFAWKRGVRVISAPTAVSVDASVTNTIAVREAGSVVYVGFVVPEVVVDLDLVQRAPRHLNRAGVGDLLSIHTASFDWRLAAAAGEANLDEHAAARAARLLDSLFAAAAAVRDVTDEALSFLVRGYIENNALCLAAGTAQPEEGSEHFWAYHLEYLARRSFVHGELVSLGVVAMSELQGNDPGRVRAFLDAAGVRYQPRDLGIARDHFARSLIDLPGYVRTMGHWHTVVDERPPDAAFVARLAASLLF